MPKRQRTGGLPAARLTTLLDAMRGRRIVVIGDCMLDRYLVGDTERISPEAPVPVVSVTERRLALGGAANVAANVAALGGQAALVGVLGADRDGEALSALISAAGIGGDGLLALEDRPTTTKTRVVARGQQVVRIDEETDQPLDAAALAEITRLATAAIATADAVVFEDYDKGLLAPTLIQAAMAAARSRKVPVVVDPKFQSFFEYAGATVFKPNRRELSAAIPGIDLGSAAALASAVARLKVQHLMLTLGAGGMVVVSRDGGHPPHLIASLAREVFDVSGAGDTVSAWVASALAAGATAIEAAELANLAASVEVAKAGVATVSPEEVLAAHR
jgi:D-beta-D-heptose 7-phosphate kinase/D-beta-D-heptose 1-phosphate adenosyltransferase